MAAYVAGGRPGMRTARGRAAPLGRLARTGALALAILAVACAGRDQAADGDGYDANRAGRLFAAGYTDIADIYIDEVDLPQLVLSGLNGLDGPDTALHAVRRGARIALTVDGRTAGRFDAPDRGDAAAWGRLTARALGAAIAASPELSARNSEQLYAEVFGGVLERLDRYSRYAGAERAQDNRASRDGFGGLGVRIRAGRAGIQVLDVRDDGPAAAAGLQAGDTIVRIDGASAAGLGQREAVQRLRGPVDTPVALGLRRDGRDGLIRRQVRRAHIVPQTVTTELHGPVAAFEIAGFNQDTADSLARAVAKANAQLGPELAGYVLDLRGNPGGLLDQAVEVADLFVRRGRIVSTHGRHPDSHQYFTARADDIGRGHPIVALIDSGSASAAEIVAAAIQDNGRGLVVGSTSYGKGTVQTVLRLPNRGELTLTWARFHAPSGYTLAGRGVTPDVCTSRGGASELDAALAGLARLPEGDTACPARAGGSPADLAIARRLITDRELYRTARSGAAPALAQAAH